MCQGPGGGREGRVLRVGWLAQGAGEEPPAPNGQFVM